MDKKIQNLQFENAFADIFQFDNGTEVCEYHAMIHATSSRLSFEQQLEAILNAYNQLLDGPLQGAQAVFKRYFLSDAANQADDVIVADVTDCAKSIIQQAPLDGTKIALWVYLMTNVQTGIGVSERVVCMKCVMGGSVISGTVRHIIWQPTRNTRRDCSSTSITCN